MQNKLVYDIDESQDGKKLISFLKGEINMSTRLSRKLVRGGFVTINGKPAINSDILKLGDKLQIILETNETQDIAPEDIPIEVVYEDQDILVVNKPPFMVVHPTRSHQEGTLANGIMGYFKKTDQNCIVRLVNRLDRDTSGLVIIAKSQFAHMSMAQRLDANQIDKYYITILEGKLEGSGTIDLPIDRPNAESMKRVVMEEGQRAVTHYEVLSSNDELSCVKVKLETGRTHQIRVHMTHIGHPILGDTLYGKESEYINRQALHAYKLQFKGIRDDKVLEITAEIPDDMKKVLKIIEKDE
jgi:23S rRNA pseudouridine1911/1915/1917 synthase